MLLTNRGLFGAMGASLMLGVSFQAQAGIYAPPAGQEGSTAIAADDAGIVAWATGVAEFNRGWMNIADQSLGSAGYGLPEDGLGAATGIPTEGVVSLGDGGSITLTFDQPITNGAGADFAVFENGFSDTFLELAFVEVSSNGVDFLRFDAVSQAQTETQIGGFGSVDATDLYNLAGKYRVGFGTPFDLSELAGVSSDVDVDAITHVRLIDVVGSIDPAYGSQDSLGNWINEPYATPFISSGFDLDAVGVLNQAVLPEPSVVVLVGLGAIGLVSRRRRIC